MYTLIPAGMKVWLTRLSFACLLFGAPHHPFAQSWKELEQRTSVLNLDQGSIPFQTSSFIGQLVKSSQTLSALHPKSDTAFDFTPGDRLKARSSKGMYHPGDLNLRLRAGETKDWKYFNV